MLFRSVKIGLDAGIIVEKELFKKIKLRVDYSIYGKVENYVQNERIVVADTIYDDAVNIILYTSFNEYNSFVNEITNLTSGTALIDDIGEKFLTIMDGKILVN